MIVGDNFRFGHGRTGDGAYLAARGANDGLAVEIGSAVQYGGERISSTRVRNALALGRVEDVRAMPAARLFGNAVLSFVTKASSGYWTLFDPTNGYTAIHAAVLARLPLDKIRQRYFFESDMLFRLGTVRVPDGSPHARARRHVVVAHHLHVADLADTEAESCVQGLNPPHGGRCRPDPGDHRRHVAPATRAAPATRVLPPRGTAQAVATVVKCSRAWRQPGRSMYGSARSSRERRWRKRGCE